MRLKTRLNGGIRYEIGIDPGFLCGGGAVRHFNLLTLTETILHHTIHSHSARPLHFLCHKSVVVALPVNE